MLLLSCVVGKEHSLVSNYFWCKNWISTYKYGCCKLRCVTWQPFVFLFLSRSTLSFPSRDQESANDRIAHASDALRAFYVVCCQATGPMLTETTNSGEDKTSVRCESTLIPELSVSKSVMDCHQLVILLKQKAKVKYSVMEEWCLWDDGAGTWAGVRVVERIGEDQGVVCGWMVQSVKHWDREI